MSHSWKRRRRGYAQARKHHQQAAVARAGAGSFCPTGKVVYDTRKIARRALRMRFPSELERGFQGMREYLCPECSGWHFGHVPKWKREAAG